MTLWPDQYMGKLSQGKKKKKIFASFSSYIAIHLPSVTGKHLATESEGLL